MPEGPPLEEPTEPVRVPVREPVTEIATCLSPASVSMGTVRPDIPTLNLKLHSFNCRFAN